METWEWVNPVSSSLLGTHCAQPDQYKTAVAAGVHVYNCFLCTVWRQGIGRFASPLLKSMYHSCAKKLYCESKCQKGQFIVLTPPGQVLHKLIITKQSTIWSVLFHLWRAPARLHSICSTVVKIHVSNFMYHSCAEIVCGNIYASEWHENEKNKKINPSQIKTQRTGIGLDNTDWYYTVAGVVEECVQLEGSTRHRVCDSVPVRHELRRKQKNTRIF